MIYAQNSTHPENVEVIKIAPLVDVTFRVSGSGVSVR